jgi:hypothetical protein
VLCIAPLLIMGMMSLIRLRKRIVTANTATPNSRKAYAQTYKALKTAQRTGQVQQVYDILIHFCALFLHVPDGGITQDFLERVFKNAGMSDEELQAWNAFFLHMAAMRYAKDTEIPSGIFFEQSYHWLSRLRHYL